MTPEPCLVGSIWEVNSSIIGDMSHQFTDMSLWIERLTSLRVVFSSVMASLEKSLTPSSTAARRVLHICTFFGPFHLIVPSSVTQCRHQEPPATEDIVCQLASRKHTAQHTIKHQIYDTHIMSTSWLLPVVTGHFGIVKTIATGTRGCQLMLRH